MSYNIRSLQNFVTIAKVGGFAKAARELNLSQPCLSRSIAQLESILGQQLFSRSTAGTSITDKGRQFLPFANSILTEVRRAQDVFEGGEETTMDRVVLAVSPSLFHEGLPSAINIAMQKHPQLGLVIQSGTLEALLDGIRLREVNVAVGYLANIYKRTVSDFNGLAVEELSTRTLVPVARADHDIFKGNQNLQAASRYAWAVPHQMSVSYRFETTFFRRDIPIPPQRLNCTSMSLMKGAIMDGALIGMLPASLAAEELASGALRALDILELHFQYSLIMITAKDAPLSSGAQAMAQIVRDTFKEN